MASTSDDLFTAIEAGDIGGVETILDGGSRGRRHATTSRRLRTDASAATGSTRVSSRSCARTRGALDIFEAAALGDLDRLESSSTPSRPRRRATRATGSRRCTSRRSSASPEAAALLHRTGRRGRRVRPRMDDGHRAALRGEPLAVDVVRILLEAGANPERPPVRGMDAAPRGRDERRSRERRSSSSAPAPTPPRRTTRDAASPTWRRRAVTTPRSTGSGRRFRRRRSRRTRTPAPSSRTGSRDRSVIRPSVTSAMHQKTVFDVG